MQYQQQYHQTYRNNVPVPPDYYNNHASKSVYHAQGPVPPSHGALHQQYPPPLMPFQPRNHQASHRVPVPILSSAPGRENTNRRSNHRGGRSRNQRANVSSAAATAPHVQKHQQHQQQQPVPPPRPPSEPRRSNNFQPPLPPCPPPSAPPPGAPPSPSPPAPTKVHPPQPVPPPLQAPVVAAPPLSAPPAPPHPPPVVPLAVEEVEAEATSGRRLYERGGTKSAASAATAAAAVTLLDTNACGDALATSQLSHFLRSSPQGVKRMSEDGHHLEQELEKQRSHEGSFFNTSPHSFLKMTSKRQRH